MSFFRKLTSVALSACMTLSIVSVGGVIAIADTPQTVETYAQETVSGSAILHCWNWSYNNIRENLADIAKAGYTAVQTSPVQPPKDYRADWVDVSGQWWKLYQPLDLSITDGQTYGSWLGTATELRELCIAAEDYGIKVIVDIVANHLANDGSDDHNVLSPNVPDDFKQYSEEYFHNYGESGYNNRYDLTQRHIGQPDLNTGNSTIQYKVYNLLKACIDCGVDGFRFDAAKHIETPSDYYTYASDFWPDVLDRTRAYASQQGLTDLFIYGEILDGVNGNYNDDADISLDAYTQYMAVTDNKTGNDALSNAAGQNAAGLSASNYDKDNYATNIKDPSNYVLWAESHDTYIHNESSWATNEQIVRTWAIVGARANSTSLFFARPNVNMGAISTDGTWKSTAVAEVNKFKNAFEGKSEYLSSYGSTAYIERGEKGMVISKLNGGGEVSLPVHQMAAGTYRDQVSGATFTVAGGYITGNVNGTGVAVVYNVGDVEEPAITADTLYLVPNSNWKQGNARFAMYLFNDSSSVWVSMNDEDEDGIYEAKVPTGNEWKKVIFCRMNPASDTNDWQHETNMWNQTSDLFPNAGNNCYTVEPDTWDNGSGTWSKLYDHTHTYSGAPTWIWDGTASATALFACDHEGCDYIDHVAAAITASYTDDKIIYTAAAGAYTDSVTAERNICLIPNENWKEANARFALFTFDNNGTTSWTNMTKVNDDCYSVTVPEGGAWSGIIFCRMNPGTTVNDWSNKWNQTINLSLPTDAGTTFYEILSGSGDNYMGEWTSCPHYYGEPVWTWEEGTENPEATAAFTCTVCGDVKTVSARPSSAATTFAPTCTTEGVMTYTAVISFNGQDYTDTHEAAIPTIAHNYGDPIWHIDDNHTTATASFRCYVGAHTDTVTDDELEVTVTTTESSGTWYDTKTYTASVDFNGQTYTQTWTEEELHEHSYSSDPIWTWADDYSTASAIFICSVCHQPTLPVSAVVTQEGNIYTATVTFEDNTYTATMTAAAETGKGKAYDRLSAQDQELYDALFETAQNIVNGTADNTAFTITADDFQMTWTVEELGLSNPTGQELANAMLAKVQERFNYNVSLILKALISDHPYEFYWFDATTDEAFSVSYRISGVQPTYSNSSLVSGTLTDAPVYTGSLKVSPHYQGSTDTSVNTDEIAVVQSTVPIAAQTIVDRYAGSSDYEKLLGYATEICRATNYNYDAFENSNNPDKDRDAWQVVYVFDNDPDTTVVCEGYAKAFQYLCSLTDFSDSTISSYMVTGQLGSWDENNQFSSGPHMWNIVTMEDGANYLVDVTNSDDNDDLASIVTPSTFLLRGADLLNPWWIVLNENNPSFNLYFAYDNDTETLWGDDVLTLSSTDYTIPSTDLSAELVGQSITLDGSIGVNLTMELSPTIARSATAYIEFTIPTDNGPKTQKSYVHVAPYESNNQYQFTCRVAAKEMASVITAQIVDPDHNWSSEVYTTSVKEYAYKLIELAQGDSDESLMYQKAVPLVKAMLNYGSYAKKYFDPDTPDDELANAGLSAEERTLADRPNLTGYDVVKNLPGGVTLAGSTVSLKSVISLSLYFRADDELTFTDEDGDPLLKETSADGYQIVRIQNVPIAELADAIRVNVTTSNGTTGSVEYPPMRYCQKALASNDEGLKDVITALYTYYQEADTFFSTVPYGA